MIIDDLLKDLKSRFSLIADPRKGDNTTIKLVDVFLNSFAIFSLKDESLNIYVKQFKQRLPNLKKLFGIRRCPSDTALREILDEVPPESLQSLSVQYIDLLLAEGHTDCFELNAVNLKKHFYVPIDGTTYFSSKGVCCESCQTKNHKNGTVTHSHSALVAVLAHPNLAQVLPIASEDIRVQDGSTKNDHELCAAKRLLPLIKQALGSHKALIGGDGLFANASLFDM